MNDQLLHVEYPDRFPTCGDCAVAIAFASTSSTQARREFATFNQMGPISLLNIHCSDWIDSQTIVPDPSRQTAMQAQAEDGHFIVGLTEPKICECPGKAIRLPSQSHLLQNG